MKLDVTDSVVSSLSVLCFQKHLKFSSHSRTIRFSKSKPIKSNIMQQKNVSEQPSNIC